MKALTKKIIRLARRRDGTPPGPANTLIDEPGMQATIERAEAAMAERDWGRATALWRKILGQFGDHAPREAHLGLYQALRHDGRVIAAQAALLERLKRDPKDHRLRRELTDLTTRRADLATSQADWERVASLWEDVLRSASAPTSDLANGLAGALCQLGRFREADDVLQRALAVGINRRDLQPVFDSEVVRTQFLGRFAQTTSGTEERWLEEDRWEWYRLAVGARRLRGASLNAAVAAPSAIWVCCGWGRWGNNVWQLGEALEAAEWLDVPRVYIPPAWYLDGDHRIYVRGHEVIQSDSPSPEEELVLRGCLSEKKLLNLLRGNHAAPPGMQNPYLRLAELRPFTRFRDLGSLREDDLVIHVRAGDVFRKERVYKPYGQPPLAYYTTVLRQRRWRSVHVVFENDNNPVIEPLLDQLRAEGIEPRTVVTDLKATIEFLLRAKTIVAGRGTFIPTIAGLSTNLRHLYTFEGTDPGEIGSLALPRVVQIDVIDNRGDYRRGLMSANWENRPDQVELMLRYPESALRVVQRGPACDQCGTIMRRTGSCYTCVSCGSSTDSG